MDQLKLSKSSVCVVLILSGLLTACKHEDKWVKRYLCYGRWEHAQMLASGASPDMPRLMADAYLAVRLIDRFDTTSTLLMIRLAGASESERTRYQESFYTGLLKGGPHRDIPEVRLSHIENQRVDNIQAMINAGEYKPALRDIEQILDTPGERQVAIAGKLLALLAIAEPSIRPSVRALIQSVHPVDGAAQEFWDELATLIEDLD